MKKISSTPKTKETKRPVSVPVKKAKKSKGFKFQIEFCPNQNIIILHTRKMFPKSQTDPLMRISFDKKDKYDEGNNHPLIKSIRRFKGVLKVSSETYELRIEKAELFGWDELLPKVRVALKTHFANGKELDEVPAQRPSAEYLQALRRQGCGV